MNNLLEVKNVSRHFGGLVALQDVSFSVSEGEIVGLIGPNGAGKSTMFNVITGFFPPTKGHIIFKGEDISHMKPHQIARRGIVRSFQLNVLFPDFTVLENVLLGSHLKSSVWKALFSRSAIPVNERKRAGEILDFTGLTPLKDMKAGELPHGYQRMLAIAMALGADPELILLDEPVTGMNSNEIDTMTGMISTLQKDMGITVIIVEHNVKTVMNLCQKIIVLNFGSKICEGCPSDVRCNPDVIEAYLGRETA